MALFDENFLQHECEITFLGHISRKEGEREMTKLFYVAPQGKKEVN